MSNENEQAIGEITELSTEEVSLVDRAANRKRFLIVKNEDGTTTEVPEESNHEEILEQSQGDRQEDVGEVGLGGSGEGLGSGEAQTGEDREVTQAVDETAVPTVDAILKGLQTAVEEIRAEYQTFQKAFDEHPTVVGLRAELQKSQEALVVATALNKECRDLLAKVRDTLAPSTATQVTKAAPEAMPVSNANSRVVESTLVTQEPTGFLRTSGDLNRSLRREKSKK